MTRSAGFLIEATGADITLAELTVLLNDGFEDRIAPRRAADAGRRAGCSPSWPRTRSPRRWSPPRTARIIDRVLPSLGPEHFALTVAGDEVERTKPHPDPYLTRRRGPRRGPGAVRGHRGHRDGCRVRRGRRLPGGGRALRGADRPRRRRTVVPSLEEVDLTFLRGLLTV